jgi:tetratricopeptide (TPR) repeat protein
MDSLNTGASRSFADPPKIRREDLRQGWSKGDLIAGRYQVHEVHEGGMGVVYLCYDQLVREPIAIKTYQSFKTKRDSSGAVVRTPIERVDLLSQLFESEALVWVQLGRHPNIVEAKYVVRFAGKPYVFLEYVPGPMGEAVSLRELLRKGEVDRLVALHMVIQLCMALEYATGVFPGLVHRDLKPENLLLTAENHLKVTDFGITKVFSDLSGSEIGLAGTPLYMSPEQCLGVSRLDTRSDIYAVGIILYELLTGVHPFKKSWTNSKIEIFRKHLVEEPLPPNRLDPSIPDELSDLVMLCLHKKPEARLNGFTELKARLVKCYEGVAGHAPKLPASEGVPGVSSLLRARAVLSRAVSLASLGRYDEAMSCFNLAVEEDPEYAFAWVCKGEALSGIGRYDQALECFDKAISLQPRNGDAWFEKGRVLSCCGWRAAALACFDQAISFNPWHVAALYEKGVALFFLGRYDEAAVYFSKVQQLESGRSVSAAIEACASKRADKSSKIENRPFFDSPPIT